MPVEKLAEKHAHAELVEELANTLIPSLHSEIATARIAYVFTTTEPKKDGRPVLGKVTKVAPLWSFLTNYDFVIEMPLKYWNDMTLEQRTAALDHLLEQCTSQENENDGSLKWIKREPEVKEFGTILQRHGAWREDLVGFCGIAAELRMSDSDDMVDLTQSED